MRRPINYRPFVGMILLLTLAMIGMNLGHSAHASGSAPVMVTNTPTNPVPVTGTITGNVSVTNIPSVSISNTPNVTLSGTPVVSLAGTPTVNLGNGSSVSLSGGSATVDPAPIVDNQANVIFEPGEDLGGTKDYPFPRTVQASCLIIATSNDIDVILDINPPSGIPYKVPLGRIRAGASPVILNFVQPVPIYQVTVHNPDILVHATFAISALGN